MNVQELYQKKLTTAAEAVKAVKSGDWVDYGWCTNHPYTLDKALAARQSELRDVKVRGGVTMWMPEICKAEDAGEHFTWHSWHCSGIDRKIIAKGMGYFSPMRYSELPRFYRDGNAKVDVAMIQVTPMDKHGNFSYALACSHLADMLDNAKTVIVEVNENLLASGHTLKDITLPENTLVMMVCRDGEYFVPQGKTELKLGDKLLVISDRSEELASTYKDMGIDDVMKLG